MNFLIGDLLILFSDLGSLAFFAIVIGQILRFAPQAQFQQIAIGIVFGLVTILSIINRSYTPHFLPYETETIYLGFVTAFIGWPAALISLTLTLLFKISQELVLTPASLHGALLGLLTGSVWHLVIRKRSKASFLLLLGVGVTVSSAALPGQIAALEGTLLTAWDLALTFALSVVLGIAFGMLIERERVLIFGEQQLRRDANTDELTGLQNRRTLTAAFEIGNIGKSNGQAVMLVDIDNFKSINDAHGHAAGDQVLRHVATVMQQAIRNGDLLVRYGGEEFAVLITANSDEEAVLAGERIRSAIERTRVSFGQLSVAVTVSVGLSWWIGKANRTIKVEQADAALYQAKRNGRNQVISHRQIASQTEKICSTSVT